VGRVNLAIATVVVIQAVDVGRSSYPAIIGSGGLEVCGQLVDTSAAPFRSD